MKSLFCLLLFVLMPTLLFAQQKEQFGRYQIFRVASMTKQYNVGKEPVLSETSGGSEDVLLLDTQTGRTWMLSNYGEDASSSHVIITIKFHWVEIHYDELDIRHLDDETFFPPPDKKKK